MEPLFLNFPTFYHSAIKGNTNLSQFNAVSVLLLGKVREKCTDEVIDDPSVSVYVSGKKQIRKSILTPLLSIPHKEIVGRLNMLGIQDIQRMVDALTTLIGEVANLSDTAKAPLLELARTAGSEYDFVAKTFLIAIKCPAVFRHRLSDETIQYLSLLGWPEQTASISNQPISTEQEQEQESEPEHTDDAVDPEEQHKKTRISIEFSQAAQEVFVSFRNLSIPEDKEATLNYFQSIFDGSLVNLDRTDVEILISHSDGFCYSILELLGTSESICSELSRWKKIDKCKAYICEIELTEDAEFEDVDKITSCIQDLVPEDVMVLLGVKFAPDLAPTQFHVYCIFQIQNSSLQNGFQEEKSDPPNVSRGSEPKSESDDDMFADIEKIFERARR